MLVNDIGLRVKRQFGDEAGIQVTDADIIRWVNDAQREIAKEDSLLQTFATTSAVANQQEYVRPPDILVLRSVHYNGIKLKGLAPQEAEDYIATKDTPIGEPQVFWIWANKIFLYPIPSANLVDGIRIFYTRLPKPVDSQDDAPEINVEHHGRIVEYALQQAYEMDENWQAAQMKQKQFKDGMEAKPSEPDPSDYYATITVRPEDM